MIIPDLYVFKLFLLFNLLLFQVRLRFIITQHFRDAALLKSFIEYFDCGTYYTRSNKIKGDFVVNKFKDITTKIIPFFEKYKIIGIKFHDFEDFKQVAKLMSTNLTREKLEQIRKIKSRMNSQRQHK